MKENSKSPLFPVAEDELKKYITLNNSLHTITYNLLYEYLRIHNYIRIVRLCLSQIDEKKTHNKTIRMQFDTQQQKQSMKKK